MKNNTELVDVYPYKWEGGEPLFLLMQRSPQVIYAGEWRMVGGKVHPEETATEAALREFEEETMMQARQFWCVPSVNSFFDFKGNKMHHIPVFAIGCKGEAEPQLNHEHISWQWLNSAEAVSLVKWPEQQRIIELMNKLLINNNSFSDEWMISQE